MNDVVSKVVPAAMIRQATVLRVEGDETVVVSLSPDGDEILCQCLETGALTRLHLAPKDNVLLWQSDPTSPRGVVLGRVGLSHAECADEIVIEAKRELMLRVGDGSITIREDGKILIKGKDLVSHAQRMNRIKGGAVSIN